MIVTAQPKMVDPVLSLAFRVMGGGRTEQTLQSGLVEIPHFSPEHAYLVGDTLDVDIDGLHGVSDTPQQALDYANNLVGQDDRAFCVFVTHIKKEPENSGRGGGWRWHKWGEYIGTGKPQREYLDDEDGFDDGVYVFSINPVEIR